MLRNAFALRKLTSSPGQHWVPTFVLTFNNDNKNNNNKKENIKCA